MEEIAMATQLADDIKNAQLTKLEKKIAEYFLENETRICFMTVSEIARALNTSDTSIIRFARSLGYSGYNDLQKHMQVQLSSNIASGANGMVPGTLSDRFENSLNALKDDSIIKKSMGLAFENLTSCVEVNGAEKFESIADHLLNSNNKYIVGLRSSRNIARHFAKGLRHVMKNVIDISAADESMFERLLDMEKGDLLLLICYSRYTEIDGKLRDIAISKGVTYCVITDKPISPAANGADIMLLVDTKSIGFFNSHIASILAEEIILAIVAKRQEQITKKRLAELDQYKLQ